MTAHCLVNTQMSLWLIRYSYEIIAFRILYGYNCRSIFTRRCVHLNYNIRPAGLNVHRSKPAQSYSRLLRIWHAPTIRTFICYVNIFNSFRYFTLFATYTS